jgi:hypothetical protein
MPCFRPAPFAISFVSLWHTSLCTDFYICYIDVAKHDAIFAWGGTEYSAAVSSCLMKRMQVHDGPLQRLAVFLDPSFRSVVADSMGLVSLLQQVRQGTSFALLQEGAERGEVGSGRSWSWG